MSSSIGRISRLDASSRAKLDAACNYLNAEVEKHARRVILWTAASVVAAIVVWLLTRIDNPMPFVGVVVLVGFGSYRASHNALTRDFKHIVVRRVVSALGEGLKYSPESSLTKQDFLDMDLFSQIVEHWESEDEIAGRKGDVGYTLHECRATRTEGSGKHRRTIIIFRGLIVRLDFNKHFAGHTVVVPNAESQILGGLFGEAESRRRKALCRMENVEFEDAFSVYSTDDQQARYILTPKVLELIVKAKRRFDGQLRLSFHDNSVFVAVPQDENRFEVRMFGASVTPEGVVGDFADVMQLSEDLIAALDLETRIWSRV